MGGKHKAGGPDLAAGVVLSDLAEAVILEGHVGEESVLLVRRDGKLYAVGARCTRYGGPLGKRLVVGDTAQYDFMARFITGGKTLAVATIYRDLESLRAEADMENRDA